MRITNRLILVGCCFISSCTVANLIRQPIPPEVSLDRIELGEISLTKTTVYLNMTMSNLNDFPFPEHEVNFTVSASDALIANSIAKRFEAIPALSEKKIRLPLNIDLVTAAKVVKKSWVEGKISYLIDGEIAVYGLKFPFEIADSFYLPSVNLKNFKSFQHKAGEIEITADLVIDNTRNLTVEMNQSNLVEDDINYPSDLQDEDRSTVQLEIKLFGEPISSIDFVNNLKIEAGTESVIAIALRTSKPRLKEIYQRALRNSGWISYEIAIKRQTEQDLAELVFKGKSLLPLGNFYRDSALLDLLIN